MVLCRPVGHGPAHSSVVLFFWFCFIFISLFDRLAFFGFVVGAFLPWLAIFLLCAENAANAGETW